jgi:flavodoxin
VNSVVVYASRHGNTLQVAEAIADALRGRGEVRLFEADDAPSKMPTNTDLVVVGGPTEGRSMTEAVTQFFGRLEPGALDGIAAAAFDTRVTWPRMLSGSAAEGIVERLKKAGARVVVPPESFMVSMKPALQEGELERVPGWVASVAEQAAAEQGAVPARR